MCLMLLLQWHHHHHLVSQKQDLTQAQPLAVEAPSLVRENQLDLRRNAAESRGTSVFGDSLCFPVLRSGVHSICLAKQAAMLQ
jgi:hypothetical protein